MTLFSQQAVLIDYTNHRGERAQRRVVPLRLEHRTSDWHAGGWQWILVAVAEDGVIKDFAMNNVHGWGAV